jgi:hypothetical protein
VNVSAWLSKTIQRCHRCDYDVTQTLRDGLAICPECGVAVSPENCTRDLDYLPRRVRRWVYVSWLGPVVAMAAGIALASWQPWLAPVAIGMFALSLAAVYAGWWWIERWLEGSGAWARAILPSLLVVLITMVGGAVLAVVATLVWEMA